MSRHAKKVIEELFAIASVQINGHQPWDIQVHNNRFYERLLTHGSLGLGEAYMDGWWDSASLDQFFFRIIRTNLGEYLLRDVRFLKAILQTKLYHLVNRLINFQSPARAFEVGQKHYDIGNDLFRVMLDPLMNYSCGYWRNSDNLADAQIAKLKLACDKLQLQPGMRVLDIGCGWGSFAKFAAENYGVSVLGITVSEKQAEHAKMRCADLPIEIRIQDYRLVNEKFDRICSIGMFEHVGYKNYRTYMQVASRCLNDDGLFLLHTIGSHISLTATDKWINKYVFPNGMLPSVKQISAAIEKLFVMEDWHNFSTDYDKTLLAWHANFIQHWPGLKNNYDERFYRMWNYYLLSCAGAFRARDMQLWQTVLSKQGMLGGYCSIR